MQQLPLQAETEIHKLSISCQRVHRMFVRGLNGGRGVAVMADEIKTMIGRANVALESLEAMHADRTGGRTEPNEGAPSSAGRELGAGKGAGGGHSQEGAGPASGPAPPAPEHFVSSALTPIPWER